MKEFKSSKCYFGHLFFYYESRFIFPISAIIDKEGIVICFGFWGITLYWKRCDWWKDEE